MILYTHSMWTGSTTQLASYQLGQQSRCIVAQNIGSRGRASKSRIGLCNGGVEGLHHRTGSASSCEPHYLNISHILTARQQILMVFWQQRVPARVARKAGSTVERGGLWNGEDVRHWPLARALLVYQLVTTYSTGQWYIQTLVCENFPRRLGSRARGIVSRYQLISQLKG